MSHHVKMASARAYVLQKAPYFSSAVYALVPKPMPGIKTMLVTKQLVMGYDPAWAERATVEELGADIAHEVNHFLRHHFERAGKCDPSLWNIAGDLAINPNLRNAGWQLAKDAIFPESFNLPEGKSAEEYYQLLRNAQLQQPQLQDAPKQGEKPQPPQPEGGPEEQDGGGQPMSPPPPAVPKPGTGRCGSIGGHSDPEIEKALEKEEGLGRDPAEMQGIAQRTLHDVKEHAAKHGRGSVPGDLLEHLKAFEEVSKVHWKDLLAHIIRDATGRFQAGGDDFSLRRPSKRSCTRGFLRPGLIEHLPEVAIVRDTSGSMGQKQLADATREAYAIMQALSIEEVWFADADTALAMPWRRVGGQFFKTLTEAKGRGGTDFQPAIDSALTLQPRPNVIVYVTDGDGSVAEFPPPDVEVVWVIVPSYYKKPPATWGKTVFVED
jgi:hypothetical protein